jgi:hypothetical protein
MEIKPTKLFRMGATKEAMISKMLKLKSKELSAFYADV